MRKISSILPANSRITNVDLTNGPTRRPGAYSAIDAGVKKSEPLQESPPKNRQALALDKVTLSSEAQVAKNKNLTKVPESAIVPIEASPSEKPTASFAASPSEKPIAFFADGPSEKSTKT